VDVVVEVCHEDPIAGTLELVHTARMVYVALAEDHRPAPVPPLVPQTELEILRHAEAMERRSRRNQG
jgi:acyl-CoA hydrolase